MRKCFLSEPSRPIQRYIHGFNTTTNDAANAKIVKTLTWASGSQTTLKSRLEVLFDNFLFDSNSIYILSSSSLLGEPTHTYSRHFGGRGGVEKLVVGNFETNP